MKRSKQLYAGIIGGLMMVGMGHTLLGQVHTEPSQKQVVEVKESIWETRKELPYRAVLPNLAQRPPKTLSISASSPFFDDFSSPQSLPDSNLWWIDEGQRSPIPTYHMAIAPPSWGVLTFDGTDQTGLPYSTQNISSGVADILSSHFIDLSPYSPADQLLLTFFLQPQGSGNAPEPSDVFEVLCTRSDQPLDSLETLLTIPGENLSSFRQYRIPLNDTAYFHDQFQLIFRSIGSLNGYLDHWHLDYVQLGLNRSPADTVYQDQAIQDFSLTILDPFTLYPSFIFPPTSPTNSIFSVRVNNLSAQPATVGTQLTLTEPSGNTLLFNRDLEVFPNQANSLEVLLRDALSPFSGSYGTLDVGIQLDNAGSIEANDFLHYPIRIDSLMGYDDNEADESYGLTRASGFGLQYALPSGTSAFLSALWISFVPRVDVNPGTGAAEYLQGKDFQLGIWDAPHPDSLLYSQRGARVQYGDSLNHFQRFELNERIPLPDTFWVGIIQSDGVPIGVGLDRNAPSGFLYWDLAGAWIRSEIQGLPMIRPEIMGEPSIPTSNSPLLSVSGVSLYPNPLEGKTLFLEFPSENTSGSLELWNLKGKKVFEQTLRPKSTHSHSIPLPQKFPKGIYIWKARVQVPGRGELFFTNKLLIN